MKLRALAVVLSLGIPISAQDLRGPVTGVIHDGRSGSLRLIEGIPGAAVPGHSVTISESLSIVNLADGGIALGITKATHQLVIVQRLFGTEPVMHRVTDVADEVGLTAFASDGSAAIICFRDGVRLQLISDLKAKPVASAVFTLPVSGRITALALDSTSRALIAVAGDDDQTSVYFFSPDAAVAGTGESRPILLLSGLSARVSLEFATRNSAVIADRDRNQLFLTADISGSGETRLLADERDGLSSPSALRRTGRSLLVANSASRSIQIFDPVAGTLSRTIETAVAPIHFTSVAGEGIFLLNDPGSGPLYLFDAARESVFFVPASQEGAQ